MSRKHSQRKATVDEGTASRRIEIHYRQLNELKSNPSNPRIHSKKQVSQIAASISAFGFNVPILVERESKVIAGEARRLAAVQLGWKEVPTICLEHLSEAQTKAFVIADNRLTENASWNEQLLAQQLKELSLAELNFSIEATGFEMAEIDLMIEGLSPAHEEDDDPDHAPSPRAARAVSRAGDLWLLNTNRLYCGSALEATSYEALMDQRKAAMAFSDAPYNLRIVGHVSGNGATKHREFAMGSGEMSAAEFTLFLTNAFRLAAKHSADGSIHFQCMDWRHLSEILAAGGVVYTELKNVCVWVKDNAGMGSLYRSQHEMILVWKHGTAPHHNNVQLGQFGRNRSNVWRYPSLNSFGRDPDEENVLALHPTAKPVALVSDAMLDCSARGDIVSDPFLGSGTTLIAAERTGRVCYGMEIDPLYVDIAIRRWQSFTGLPARLSGDGKTFAEVEQSLATATEVAHG